MNYMGLDKNDPSDQSLIGAVTSTYMAASIVSGLLVAPFVSHYFGRRAAIFLGCIIVIIASFIQSKYAMIASLLPVMCLLIRV